MFNTAVAASMELLNAINRFEDDSERGRAVEREALEAVVLMLSPIVPHICHALWAHLGHASAVIDQSWPAVDESALERDLVEIVIQVNGKLRGKISVAADADKASIIEQALADPNAQRFIDGGEIRKTIVVPGRLVNIVV
jgi:leucyl-tRNA synthetase